MTKTKKKKKKRKKDEEDEEGEMGTYRFLTLLSPGERMAVSNSFYIGKKTYKDLYLKISSHNSLEHKLSVLRSLTARCNSVVTEENDRKAEVMHIEAALSKRDRGKSIGLHHQSWK